MIFVSSTATRAEATRAVQSNHTRNQAFHSRRGRARDTTRGQFLSDMFLLQDGQGDSQLHLIDTRLQALVINEGAQKLQDACESFYFSNLV